MKMMLVLLFACIQHPEPQDAGPMVQLEKQNGQQFYMDVFEYPNQKGDLPKAELDFTTAVELCTSVGKRLCTMEEWKIGCGSTQFTYGENYEHGRCYTNQQNEQGHTSLMHGRTAQIASGQSKECQSPNGLFDMNGNLEEWVSDDWRGMKGNLAGGAWYTHWRYADCTARYSREPDYRLAIDRPTDSAGVRCCWSDWEPTEADIQQDANEQRQPTKIEGAYVSSNEIEIDSGIWMDQYEYPNQKGALPQVSVDWFEADKLCKENGKELCSVTIWEKACLGKENTLYPYGNRHQPTFCNDESTTLLPSGESSNCTTSTNLFDLTGNAWEWTSSDLTVSELQHDSTVPIKEIRGGSFVSDSLKAQCRPTVGYPLVSADMTMNSLGFRCCRVEKEKPSATAMQNITHLCPSDMRPYSTGCIDRYEYPNRKNTLPVHSVTLSSAQEACTNLGKHLCKDSEWTDACTGSGTRRWSYGNEFSSTTCHHAAQLHQGGAKPSGSFEDCQTPEGISDMTGNLWEWSNSGLLRGGNWNFSEGMGQCLSTAKPAAHIHNDEIGFRCCATIKESTLLLSVP